MNLLCSMDQNQLKYWDLRKNDKSGPSNTVYKPILQTKNKSNNAMMVDLCEMNGLIHTVMSDSTL